MKTAVFSILLYFGGATTATAQNNYLVTTSQQKSSSLSEEEQFMENYFSLKLLCEWTPGMKFMFIPDAKDQFIPILCTYENGKEINNGKFKHKIFEFLGTEEKVSETYTGTNYSTRFLFSCEKQKFYHEIKNQRIDEICQKNPRASISGLVYLEDVDIAREQLVGKVVFNRTRLARVDNANSYSGFKDVSVSPNQRMTITNVGVGCKSYPVKIIFENEQGHSYYLEVALSRTNSGMDIADFQADKKMKYFPNAFSFTDKNVNSFEALKSKYIDMPIYPKKTLAAKGELTFDGQAKDTRAHLLRYSSFRIVDIATKPPETLALLTIKDQNGQLFEVEVDLKYDFVIKNENYIEDLFGFGDLHKKYPNITAERWLLIAQGEVESGMNTDECRLSLGKPIQVELKKDNRFETWFYRSKVLEFESSILLRYK